jgi:hypothetical protein
MEKEAEEEKEKRKAAVEGLTSTQDEELERMRKEHEIAREAEEARLR